MAAACEMLQENEIELSLGLSLGGCFSKSEKLRQKSGEIEVVRSSGSPVSGGVSEENKGVQVEGEILDPQMKRQIQALRRQEAKKKREEKHQKKGSTARGGGGELKSQDCPSRVRDRDLVENETGSEQIYKKAKYSDEEDQPDVNLWWKQSHSSNPSSAFVPVVPTPYNFPHMQYIPFVNSAPVPYSVPFWATTPPPPSPASNAGGEEKSVFQLVACRAFQPFQAQKSNASQLGSGSSDSGSKQLHSSGGSLGSGSSGISDYQSTSHQGCCSSETRSHSTNSRSEQPQLHTMFMTDAQGQTEQTVSSHPKEPNQITEEPEQKAQKMVSSSPFQTNSEKTERKPITATDNSPSNSPTPAPQPPKEGKGEANKPPKPPQHQAQKTQALPHMPCVSTTGNGPSGKTITGFLYKYNKTEVSIMCICHGSSFTPAEFLKHAGCTDVSNPLKHIVVVPSPY